MTTPKGGWTRRDGASNLVVLGDGEGQVTKVQGLLANITPDPRFPDNKRFAVVQRDGTEVTVAGSAAINSAVGLQDVGKFLRLEFEGWQKGRNGQFKAIKVEVYDGEATDTMRQWPRWAELNSKEPRKQSRAAKPALAEPPIADPDPDEEEDDDLPF